MSAIIEGKELSLFYGIVLGLNNVSFSISEGVTGLVGPNGAGKSTLMKLLTGQVAPSSGTLTVLGENPRNNPRVLSQIGYCPEREQISRDLRPVDWLRGLAALSGIPWKDTEACAVAALRRAQLGEAHWGKRIGTYSKGMKQRVKLAQAIMHEPKIVILDEPMNGLDPMGRSEFGEVLKQLNADGTSIIVSSHILHELEFLCGSFLILNWGRALASGTHIDIRETVTQWSDEISIRCSDAGALAEHLGRLGLLRGFLADGKELTVWVKDAQGFFANWPSYVQGIDVAVFEIRNKNQSLSSIFDRMTK